MYYYFCYYCPYRLAMAYLQLPQGVDHEIDQELAPDLFDLIQPKIFQELNPEGIPGVTGIPGEQAFPQITPKPSRQANLFI